MKKILIALIVAFTICTAPFYEVSSNEISDVVTIENVVDTPNVKEVSMALEKDVKKKEKSYKIIIAPDEVAPGQVFQVQLSGNYSYTITPKPFQVKEDLDRYGNLWLLVTAGKETMTIEVDHRVIHPTVEESRQAPAFDNVDKFVDWVKRHNQDEVYSDRHVVKVGGNPGPNPNPDPTLTDFAKGVKTLADKVGNKEQAKTIADNYDKITIAISAGAYNNLANFADARAKIVSDVYELNIETSKKNNKWEDFFNDLAELVKNEDKDNGIDSVEKIKKLFAEIKTGLEAASK